MAELTGLSGVEVSERGSGPALLLIPGSFGTGAGWKPVIDQLGDRYRVITTSLLGYGATVERRSVGNATMQQQTDVLGAIVAEIGAPVHVAAHSFGGLAALAHAIDGRFKPASLCLIEANPFGILRTSGDEALYASFGAMTAVYFAEFEAGIADAARHVIDFYGGDGTYNAFPAKVRDYVMKTTASNILDWSSAGGFEPPLSAYCGLEAPTMIVRGGRGHPAMRRIAERLANSLPHARLETIADGSHFLPSTHADDVARLIDISVGSSAGRYQGT